MKSNTKNLMIIAFVTLQTLSVQSQKISYGIKVGADLTNMHLLNVPQPGYESMYSPLLSYNLNGYVSYKGDFFIGLSVEPGIIRKGGVQLFDYMNSQYQPVEKQVIASITSIQLPVLIDFHINDRLYFSSGIEIEKRISQKAIMTDKATTKHLFAGSYPLYVTRGTGMNTIGDDIIPDSNYPSIYCSFLVGIQYKINKRFDIGCRLGTNIKDLYVITWRDEFGDPMAASYIYSTYTQLSLKVRL